MKKTVFALAAIALVLVGCGQSSAPKKKVARLSPMEDFGYTLDIESIPTLIREDSTIAIDQEVYDFAGMCGHYTVIDACLTEVLGMRQVSIAFLQAVPAGTTHLRGAILKIGEIPAEEYAEYIIFSNEDIVVYDLYPIFCPSGPAPQRVKENIEKNNKSWEEQYAAGKIPEDKMSLHIPPYIELAAARSVDYVWAYYQENLPNLIVRMKT